jgi:hypothetical protein
MREFFRDQPPLRLAIGGAIVLFVWTAYAARLTLGVGRLRDTQGNPAPVLHYLVGALTVTGLVAIWIVVRGVMARNRDAQASVSGSGRAQGGENDGDQPGGGSEAGIEA